MSKRDNLRATLEHGWRMIGLGKDRGRWCTHCDAFVDNRDKHSSFCPYGALAEAMATIAQLEAENERLREIERAARAVSVSAWRTWVVGKSPPTRGSVSWQRIEKLDEALGAYIAAGYGEDE